jgi:RNA polymerase sigma-70 factor (ECF subfamily)
MAQRAGATLDSAEFAILTEPFRRELLAHCYRMLGSVDEAEDLVQETYLRAWRSHGGFEGRSSVRTWLYQIATNACLTALGRRGRRVIPSGLGAPNEPASQAPSDVAWLQPVPDAMVAPDARDPGEILAARESVRLALIASLQYLTPRQRAVLLLRDVLAFPAAEVADLVGTTPGAVKSILQRARARLQEQSPVAEQLVEPSDPSARALLDQYIAAFQTSDAAALKRLLHRDATVELVPSPGWFAGDDALACAVAGLGAPGDWRMLPTIANGQPAAASYHRGEDGRYHGYGIVVLTTTAEAITRITLFADPGLLGVFGVPDTLEVGA